MGRPGGLEAQAEPYGTDEQSSVILALPATLVDRSSALERGVDQPNDPTGFADGHVCHDLALQPEEVLALASPPAAHGEHDGQTGRTGRADVGVAVQDEAWTESDRAGHGSRGTTAERRSNDELSPANLPEGEGELSGSFAGQSAEGVEGRSVHVGEVATDGEVHLGKDGGGGSGGPREEDEDIHAQASLDRGDHARVIVDDLLSGRGGRRGRNDEGPLREGAGGEGGDEEEKKERNRGLHDELLLLPGALPSS